MHILLIGRADKLFLNKDCIIGLTFQNTLSKWIFISQIKNLERNTLLPLTTFGKIHHYTIKIILKLLIVIRKQKSETHSSIQEGFLCANG